MRIRVVGGGEAGDPSKPEDERLALFVAGDDAKAKSLVIRTIEKLGFTPLDTGGLADGGCRQQPGNPIYAADLTCKQAREALTQ
jgi:predicted dinucleotide-binding enzyme